MYVKKEVTMNKKILLTTLILSLFILSACTGFGSNRPTPNTKSERFYQGTEGIRTTIYPGSPPPNMYFYSDAITNAYNTFSINVELHNVGASWAKGGLYVSGFDPSMLYIEGIHVPSDSGTFWSHCRARLQMSGEAVSLNNLGGIMSCAFDNSGLSVFGSIDDPEFQVDNLLGFIGSALSSFGATDIGGRFQDFGDVFNFDVRSDGTFTLSLGGLTFDALYHGRAFMAFLEALNFERFNGREFFLAPDNYDYPSGESIIVSFNPSYVEKGGWPAGLDETDVTLFFTTCYGYTTFATPIVCIDPDPFSQNEKACRVGQVKMTSSQGAPVAVTRVYQEAGRFSSTFLIEIQNVGRGDVYYPGDLELCSPYYPGFVGPQSQDLVLVGDVRIGNRRLTCTPDTYNVKLRNGRGQITCRYDYEFTSAKSAYTTPLTIELWYGYSEVQRRNLRIKRVS